MPALWVADAITFTASWMDCSSIAKLPVELGANFFCSESTKRVSVIGLRFRSNSRSRASPWVALDMDVLHRKREREESAWITKVI